jgi:hypothetical protein
VRAAREELYRADDTGVKSVAAKLANALFVVEISRC